MKPSVRKFTCHCGETRVDQFTIGDVYRCKACKAIANKKRPSRARLAQVAR